MRQLLCFFLFFPLLLSAQPQATHSAVIKSDHVTDVTAITVDAGSGNIFLLYRELFIGKTISPSGPETLYRWAVDVLSPDLKPLHRNKPQKIDLPKGDEIEIGRIVSFDGKPYLIFLLHNKKESKTAVYRAPVQSDGTLGKPESVGILDGKYVESSQIMFSWSADNSLLLVMQHPSRLKPKEPFSCLVFDQKGNVRRKGNLSVPKEPTDLVVGYPLIANDGTIWAPVWTYNNSLRQEVWKWSEGENQAVKIDVAAPSKEHIVTDLRLKQSPHDGFIYAGGTFAAASGDAEKGMFKGKKWNNDPNPEQGTVSLKLDDKSGKVVSRFLQPFSATTLNFWGEKTDVLKKGGGLNSFRAVDVLPQKDGSVWVGIEQFYQIFQEGTINYTPQAIGSITDGFNYGDPCSESAIVAHHSSVGELLHEHVIGKRTWAIRNYGLGYFFTTNDRGDLVALYTDHEENPGKNVAEEKQLERTLVGGYANRKETACAAMFTAKKGDNGAAKRLFTQKESKNWLEPGIYVQTSSNTFVFACIENGSVYSFLKLVL